MNDILMVICACWLLGGLVVFRIAYEYQSMKLFLHGEELRFKGVLEFQH